ncbi:hypothetical protein M3I54_34000 [Paraburkholderia sp. CNPSo 3274]|uniref:hypothetical protein n=1 Tax=Paraburkholderia sp. CNPSo 3274 TaxID=2940932 RepID=UPI0020B7D210|nr:hypothetical protein [Paraburkholderia sp. CNPSo 3274]MCP3711906.1 hypothetical protein [Paraburkholderia sp. CNPSo 3274]
MANYQWTGSAGTNFLTPENWVLEPGGGPATVPPGPNDSVTIDNTALPITGSGTAADLIFKDTDEIAGHLTATIGIPVNARLTLKPGAILTTPRIGVITGTLTIGKDSSLVSFGPHDLNDYAIKVAPIAGNATMLVDGGHAVVNTRNLPVSVGQAGNGQMTISNGALVAIGNNDPLIYPWALVVGNHDNSTGRITVSKASLVARGQVIIGRGGTGKLELNPGASVVAEDVTIGYTAGLSQVSVSEASLVARGQVIVGQYAAGALEVNSGAFVVADDMSIGSAPTGQGSVSVSGHNARLVIANELLVQDLGTGSLTVTQKGSVSVGKGIYVTGTLSLGDGLIETTALGIDPGATLTGHGTVTAVAGFVNNGTITVINSLTLVGDMDNASTISVSAGGHLRCFGTLLSDTGTIELRADSVATVEAVQSPQTIKFVGTNARLELRSPGAFTGTIDGFAKTDTIELDVEVKSINFANNVLTIKDHFGTVEAQLQMTGGAYSTGSFQINPLSNGRSAIVIP